jgi:hypothetical protein
MESAEGPKAVPTAPAPSAAPQPDPPQSAMPLVLTVVVAVLVGAGGLTFTMLNTRANAATAANAPTGSTIARAPARSATVNPRSGVPATGWTREHAYRWVSNHPRSAAFELESRELVPVWTTQVHPTLVVRCLAKKTDVFVYTETAARIESDDQNHTVGLAFDDGAQQVERWPDSEEHDALFAPDANALAARLTSARHLAFTFTPHNAQPVTVNFDLTGADEVVSSVRKTCGAR